MMSEENSPIPKVLNDLTLRFQGDLSRLFTLNLYMHDRMMQEESVLTEALQDAVQRTPEGERDIVEVFKTLTLNDEFEKVRDLLHGFAIVHVFILLTSFVKQYLYQIHFHRARLIPRKALTEISALIEPLERREEQAVPYDVSYDVLDIFIWNEVERLDKRFPDDLNEYLKGLFGKQGKVKFERIEELRKFTRLRNEIVHYGGQRREYDAFVKLSLEERNERVQAVVILTEQYAAAFHECVSANLK